LEGELNLHYLKDNKPELAVLKPGDIFLMPKQTPHSPRRGDGSWTYVVERKRAETEMDRFVWPCEKCGKNLYEAEVRFDDPGDAVKRATDRLRSDPTLATCKQCGEILEL
jgi:3-hydroxyanthranilate 3,4-dioxygenase